MSVPALMPQRAPRRVDDITSFAWAIVSSPMWFSIGFACLVAFARVASLAPGATVGFTLLTGLSLNILAFRDRTALVAKGIEHPC
jgi:hypothetical protein